MPYRRLPNTDNARLKALETLLNNNEIYTVRNRFIEWNTINEAKRVYNKMLTANEQYKIVKQTRIRQSKRTTQPHKKALMYVSHFLQVMLLSVERGEIRKTQLPLYQLDTETKSLPKINTVSSLLMWGENIIAGEKERIKKGGRPILNPTIGMVATHFDIFKETLNAFSQIKEQEKKVANEMKQLRIDADKVILDLWNQIEKHFQNLEKSEYIETCRGFGVIYYYRKDEQNTEL